MQKMIFIMLYLFTACTQQTTEQPADDPKDTSEHQKDKRFQEQKARSDTFSTEFKEHFLKDGSIQIKLPQTWRVKGQVFYDSTGAKKGELAPGLITPVKDISGKEFLKRLKEHGPPIESEHLGYGFGEHYDVLETDSLNLNGVKWFTAVTKDPLDRTEEPQEWFSYKYLRKVNDQILIINFYYFNQQNADRKLMHKILRSIRAVAVNNTQD